MAGKRANQTKPTPPIRQAAFDFLAAFGAEMKRRGYKTRQEQRVVVFGTGGERGAVTFAINTDDLDALGATCPKTIKRRRDQRLVLKEMLDAICDNRCRLLDGNIDTRWRNENLDKWWTSGGVMAREAFRQAILKHCPDWESEYPDYAKPIVGMSEATVPAPEQEQEPQPPGPGPEVSWTPRSDQPQSGSVPVSVSGPRRPLPAAELKLDDLAQMQLDVAPGSNMAAEGTEIYQGTITIGYHETWNNELNVMVRYCLHQFVLSVECEVAVPSLPRDTQSVRFYGPTGVRDVSIHDRYRDNDTNRSKSFRFTPKDRETLEGSTDKEALLQIKGPCVAGDQVRLEIQSHHLKPMALGDDGELIEFDATEEKRIATNFLRERFVENPASRYVFVRQSLA